ncbi:MAG TPA: (2Fe-2S)-binding protein [Thermodesulfovibrionales bacterium]|nr:(2Fe-2S)-binding protein [Thermodesulfovibrionales bacterium]
MSHEDDEKGCMCGKGVTRRQFLTTMGVSGVAVAAASLGGEKEARAAVIRSGEATRVSLTINGKIHRLLVEPRWSLLYVLREELGLTGTKVGCERGECGACSVLIENAPRYACMTLAVEAEGMEITTIEGLMDGEQLGAVQQAFLEHDALQCGYCTPGQIMAVEGLLRKNREPSLDEIRRGVSGNVCRCGAYTNIFKAAKRAGELKRRGGA